MSYDTIKSPLLGKKEGNMLLGNRRTLGTCSICGGPVQVPLVWWSTVAPTASCSSCGATPKKAHGPVIEMEKLGVLKTSSTQTQQFM